MRNVCDKSSSGKRLYLIVTQDWRSPSRWWKGSFTNIYTVSTKISWILHHTRILSRWKSAAARQTQRTQCDFIIKTLKIRPSFLPEKQNEQYCPKLEAVNEGRRENLTMKKDWMEKNVPIHVVVYDWHFKIDRVRCTLSMTGFPSGGFFFREKHHSHTWLIHVFIVVFVTH